MKTGAQIERQHISAADKRLRWLLRGAGWDLAKRILSGQQGYDAWETFITETDAALAAWRSETEARA